MNAVRILMGVPSYVQTPLALTHAAAILDTGWPWIDMPAVV